MVCYTGGGCVGIGNGKNMQYGNYPDLSKVKKILIVKMRHHGDVLLSSVVFSNLKKKIPHCQIDALIYKDTYPMLEGHFAIRDFFLYDRKIKSFPFLKRIYEELKLLLKIRKKKYDLVINLTEGDRGAIAAIFSKATYRMGFDSEEKGFSGKNGCYTHIVKNSRFPRHTVEKHLDVLRCLGIFPTDEEKELHLHISEEVEKKVDAMIAPLSSDYVLIHPTSRWFFKCVPTQLIADVIKNLTLEGHNVVLTSGPDRLEREMVDDILSKAPSERVTSFSGKTTLKELACLISKAKTIITVDSVSLHMASTFKTPVVAFFGPSCEKQWGPWMHPAARIVAQNFSCRACELDGCGGSKVSDCLNSLKSQSVMEAFHSLNNYSLKSSPR
jgi:lipopolysaccharide heptosyltransferase III